MEDRQVLKSLLKDLFKQQKLAVLSTFNSTQKQPYSSLIGFASNSDLMTILFATPKATRKYANLKKTPRAALLIDNRLNQDEDFHEAIAATATGTVQEIDDIDADNFFKIFLSKHKHLEDFIKSPSTALMQLNVESYNIVSRFQDVRELRMRR